MTVLSIAVDHPADYVMNLVNAGAYVIIEISGLKQCFHACTGRKLTKEETEEFVLRHMIVHLTSDRELVLKTKKCTCSLLQRLKRLEGVQNLQRCKIA